MKLVTGEIPVGNLWRYVTDCDLPFRWMDKTSYEDINPPGFKVKSFGQAVHTIVDKATGYSFGDRLEPFKLLINSALLQAGILDYQIKSAKINVQWPVVRTDEIEVPHKDHADGGLTMIIYLSDSNGDTYFFDDELNLIERIEYKQGKFVIFDTNTIHAGSSPTQNFRIVLNVNIKTRSS